MFSLIIFYLSGLVLTINDCCFLLQVAIKTIKKSKIETEADLIRIRREIQIMSSVQHPNIIHIYEGELKNFCRGGSGRAQTFFGLCDFGHQAHQARLWYGALLGPTKKHSVMPY